jgi:signal transduction histidine kinase/CheY-like chemotaxis protein
MLTAPETRSKIDAALVKAEQLKLILSHTALGTTLATCFAVFAAYQLSHGGLGFKVPSAVLIAWLIAKLGVAVARIAHAHLGRASTSYERTIHLLAVDGLVWGMGAMGLMSAPVQTATVIAASICGVACVATFGLQVSFAATAAYVVPMIVPVTLGLLLRNDAAGMLTGVGLALLLGLMLSTAKRSDRRMTEIFALRIISEHTAAELGSAIDLMETQAGQLRSALQIAKQHAEAKDRFLAVVSHELRTPLHGIMGMIKILRSELPRSLGAQHYRLELIDEGASHLKRLVDDLLDTSLVEAGRLDLRLAPLDLQRELTLLIETYRARGDQFGVALDVDIASGVGQFVFGDTDRVAQVLHNLFSNAFKFSPLGSTVRLAVDRPNDGDIVAFAVTDSGPGIDPSQKELVFEAFEQGQDSSGLRTRPAGVGLGLTIARQLARAMGGDVAFKSIPNRSTVFRFDAKLPKVAAPPPLPQPHDLFAHRHPALRVIVADDDATSSTIVGSVVRRLGLAFDENSDGVALLGSVCQTTNRPGLVVLDWDLPNLDGGRIAQAIRRYEASHQLERIPIIGLSANASSAVATIARISGMDHFLVKPCPPERLADVLRSVLPTETQ